MYSVCRQNQTSFPPVPCLLPAKIGNKSPILLSLSAALSKPSARGHGVERDANSLFGELFHLLFLPPQCLPEYFDSLQSVAGSCCGCILLEAGSSHRIYQLCHLVCGSVSFTGGKDKKVFKDKSPYLLSTCSQPLVCPNSPLPCSSCYLSPLCPWLSLLQRAFLLPAFPCSWMCKYSVDLSQPK